MSDQVRELAAECERMARKLQVGGKRAVVIAVVLNGDGSMASASCSPELERQDRARVALGVVGQLDQVGRPR